MRQSATVSMFCFLLSILVLTPFSMTSTPAWSASPINAVENHARSLWTQRRLNSIVEVHVPVKAEGNVAATQIGTGFMVKDNIAITAAHVVCSPDKTVIPKIVLHVGGKGASVPVEPLVVECKLFGSDIAVMKLAPKGTGERDFLETGAIEDLLVDPFITSYGFGSPQIPGGRPITGSAIRRRDNDNRVRAHTLGAGKGDSGAPVLDKFGRVVGVLVAGRDEVIAMVPLRPFEPELKRLSVFLPAPNAIAPQDIAREANPSPSDLSLNGSVKIFPGEKGGVWPPARPARLDEAQVFLSLIHTKPSNVKTLRISTDRDGTWKAPLSLQLPQAGVRYAVIVTHIDDSRKPLEQPTYLQDPVYGEITKHAPNKQLDLSLYEPSAYLLVKLNDAKNKTATLTGSTEWKMCASLLLDPLKKISGCTRNNPDMMQVIRAQTPSIEEAYSHALDASLLDSGDINRSINIAGRWAAFQISTGNACSSVSTMKLVFDKFTNRKLEPNVIKQTLDMIVHCLQLPSKSATSSMPWRKDKESRQEAAISLAIEILEKFADDPAHLKQYRIDVLRTITTAFEYSDTPPISVTKAAQTISRSKLLKDSLGTIVQKYIIPWCGQRISAPSANSSSVEKALLEMRKLALSCV